MPPVCSTPEACEPSDGRISFSDTFVIFAPLADFISILPFSRGEPHASRVRGIKSHRRSVIAVQKDSIFCRYYGRFCEVTNACGIGFGTLSAAAASRHNRSRTDYTPEFSGCQYVVVTFFFNTIEWVF